ncbi:MAG: PepSY domain-containing protein [Clostridia bacterium]|nr:PepSY domain-containing protein [Clostridia bacterium]
MKKFFALTLTLIFAISLVGCGTAEKVVSDTESAGDEIISDTKSDIDKAESDIEDKAKDDEDSMNLMAGITPEDAKKAALEHAELDESQVRDVDIDLDRDNGRLIYEVDFNSGNTEYDYDIDAETGEIISADKSAD